MNAAKTLFMLFHNYQMAIDEDDIPHLKTNDTLIEQMKIFRAHNKGIHELEFSFL